MGAEAWSEEGIARIDCDGQRCQTRRTDTRMEEESIQLIAIRLVRSVRHRIARQRIRTRSSTVVPTNWAIADVVRLALGVALAVTHRFVGGAFGKLTMTAAVVSFGQCLTGHRAGATVRVESFGAIAATSGRMVTARIIMRAREIVFGGDHAFATAILETVRAIRPAVGSLTSVISIARLIASSVTVLQALVTLPRGMTLAATVRLAPAHVPRLVARRRVMMINIVIMTTMIVHFTSHQTHGGHAQDH